MSKVFHFTPKPRGDTFQPCMFEAEERREALIQVLNPEKKTGKSEGCFFCEQASLLLLGK